MSIKLRLTILNFLQFFVFGTWLLSFGKYMGATLHFEGTQIGAIFMTLGIASLFMPALLGIIADRWTGPNRLFAASHIIGAVFLYFMAQQTDFDGLYIFTLLYLMFYMPTIALDNTISYCIMNNNDMDVVKEFPPIRVWGTIGFILATWVTDYFGWGINVNQFYFAAGASVVLGLFTLTLPNCAIEKDSAKKTLVQALGLDAFVLFKDRKMAIFFIFSMLLGAALQITNMWGEAFLHDFSKFSEFKETFIVAHNGIVMSISQISETIFILTIPFFLKKYGIKKVMLMSMLAWFLRFALFGIGSPVGIGAAFLILSMIVYGMAFDFFNISGSLFVELEADPKIRASAQGLFIIMTNGLGAMIGAYGSGYIIDLFTKNGDKDWSTIWFVFAAYSITIAVLFALLFKYKHDPDKIKEIKH
ncbi:MAG: nucleoside permease [Chlorobi bacterium]|nr:nucleoside permease [Chlorobiota bacterium]